MGCELTWSYIPSKFALASECWAKDCELGSTIWASRIAPLHTLNGKHTQPASWQRAWKKAPWTRHLSGLTYSPSTVQSGVTQWIASLRDSRAKTLALPGGVLGLMGRGLGCSSTSSTLPTLAVRDTCFWRTSQASLLPPPPLWTKPKGLLKNERPPESWENWPTAGGMRNGSLFQRPTWVPAMAEPGGSALPGGTWSTPRAEMDQWLESELNRKSPSVGAQAASWATPDCNTSTYSNGKMGPNIREQASQWLTPNVPNVPNGGRSVSEALVQSKGMTPDGQKRTVGLESQTKFWATPKTITGGANSQRETRGAGGPDLQEQVNSWNANSADTCSPPALGATDAPIALAKDLTMWPTPSASVANDGESPETWHAHAALLKTKHGNGNGAGIPLTVATAQWPTPAARDSKGPNSEEHAMVTGGGRKHMDQLANFVAYSPLAQATRDGETSSPDDPGTALLSVLKGRETPRLLSKRLNPYFGEWLMGWPLDLTSATEPNASSALEMELFRSKLRQQLLCLFDGQAS